MNLKYLLIIFSIVLFLAVIIFEKKVEDFLFRQKVVENSHLLASQVNQNSPEENSFKENSPEEKEEKLEDLKPLRILEVEEPKIGAKSAISVFLNNDGKEKILFEKEKEKILPIASLTKLMTAFVILENYNLEEKIKITKEAISQEGAAGKLAIGQVLPVKYLLYPLLIESSNDAAFSLVNGYNEMGEEKFVELMNSKAKELDLKNTNFLNSTGLDPEGPKEPLNSSTAEDLVKLTKKLLEKPLIWEILSTQKINLYGPELINTNKLLEDAELTGLIVGGKTGYTEKSGGCILLVLKAPKNQGLLINIILGSEDRFEEMRKLINWLNLAYQW